MSFPGPDPPLPGDDTMKETDLVDKEDEMPAVTLMTTAHFANPQDLFNLTPRTECVPLRFNSLKSDPAPDWPEALLSDLWTFCRPDFTLLRRTTSQLLSERIIRQKQVDDDYETGGHKMFPISHQAIALTKSNDKVLLIPQIRMPRMPVNLLSDIVRTIMTTDGENGFVPAGLFTHCNNDCGTNCQNLAHELLHRDHLKSVAGTDVYWHLKCLNGKGRRLSLYSTASGWSQPLQILWPNPQYDFPGLGYPDLWNLDVITVPAFRAIAALHRRELAAGSAGQKPVSTAWVDLSLVTTPQSKQTDRIIALLADQTKDMDIAKYVVLYKPPEYPAEDIRYAQTPEATGAAIPAVSPGLLNSESSPVPDPGSSGEPDSPGTPVLTDSGSGGETESPNTPVVTDSGSGGDAVSPDPALIESGTSGQNAVSDSGSPAALALSGAQSHKSETSASGSFDCLSTESPVSTATSARKLGPLGGGRAVRMKRHSYLIPPRPLPKLTKPKNVIPYGRSQKKAIDSRPAVPGPDATPGPPKYRSAAYRGRDQPASEPREIRDVHPYLVPDLVDRRPNFRWSADILVKLSSAERKGRKDGATHLLVYQRPYVNYTENLKPEYVTNITNLAQSHITVLMALMDKAAAAAGRQPEKRSIQPVFLPFPLPYFPMKKAFRSFEHNCIAVAVSLVRQWSAGLPFIADRFEQSRYRRQLLVELYFDVLLPGMSFNPDYTAAGQPQRSGLSLADCIPLAEPSAPITGKAGKHFDTAVVKQAVKSLICNRRWLPHVHFLFPEDVIYNLPESEARSLKDATQTQDELNAQEQALIATLSLSAPAIPVTEYVDIADSDDEEVTPARKKLAVANSAAPADTDVKLQLPRPNTVPSSSPPSADEHVVQDFDPAPL
jgi:hypothetical protein